MAAIVKKVVVAVNDSPFAENAFECKLFIIIGYHGNILLHCKIDSSGLFLKVALSFMLMCLSGV